MPTKEEIIERTKKAFAPPTTRQLEQQARAKAKGGLSPRGVAEFNKRAKEISKREGISKEEAEKGLLEGSIQTQTGMTYDERLKAKYKEFRKTGNFGGSPQEFQRASVLSGEGTTRLTSQVVRIKDDDTSGSVLKRIREASKDNEQIVLERKTYQVPKAKKFDIRIGDKNVFRSGSNVRQTSINSRDNLFDKQVPKASQEYIYKRNVSLGQETQSIPQKQLFVGKSMVTEVEKPTDYLERFRQKLKKAEYKSLVTTGSEQVKYKIGAFVGGTAYGIAKPILRPRETIIGAADFVVGTIFEPRKTKETFVTQLRTEPYFTTGELTGTALLPSVVKGVYRGGQNIYIKAGSRYVEPEAVISQQVISGQRRLPIAKTLKESVSKFKESRLPTGEYEVISYSPAKIKGFEAAVGKKATTLSEDPGIYVAPVREGSPYFTRLSKNIDTQYSFSILPENLGVPTGTVFKAAQVARQPRSVVKTAGFEKVGEFLTKEGEAQRGTAFITKRSELGLGGVQRQRYKTPEGTFKYEPGTSEIEAVIPPKQRFFYEPTTRIGRFKGFEEYTTFEGKPVAIRRARLVEEGKPLPKMAREFTKQRVVKESKAISSLSKEYKNVSASGAILKSSPLLSTLSSPRSAYSSGLSKSKSTISSPLSRLSSGKSITSSKLKTSSKPSSILSKQYSKLSSSASQLSSYLTGGSSTLSSASSRLSSYVTGGSSYYGGASTIQPPVIGVPSGKLDKKKKKKYLETFDVFLKRGGKFQKVGRELTMGRAYKTGVLSAKKGLGATFKLVETGKLTTNKDIAYTPTNEFRSFKISKGKRIETPLTYIQKRKYRLGTFGEKQEIKMARLR